MTLYVRRRCLRLLLNYRYHGVYDSNLAFTLAPSQITWAEGWYCRIGQVFF